MGCVEAWLGVAQPAEPQDRPQQRMHAHALTAPAVQRMGEPYLPSLRCKLASAASSSPSWEKRSSNSASALMGAEAIATAQQIASEVILQQRKMAGGRPFVGHLPLANAAQATPIKSGSTSCVAAATSGRATLVSPP